jgi:hypothetical protein
MMSETASRIIALAIIAAAIPFPHLLDSGYSVLHFEVVAITLLFGAAGALLGLLTARGRFYAPALVLLVYVFADANIVESKPVYLALLLAFCIALAAWMPRIESWAVPVLTTFILVFSLSSVLTVAPGSNASRPEKAAPAASATTAAKPAVLHIVLDEMMSLQVEGATPAPGHPAARLVDDLVARGFQVHERADVISHNTYKSVSAVVGITTAPNNFTKPTASRFSYEVKENRLFTEFARAGYAVSAVQVNFLDLCHDNPDFDCQTYTRAANMGVFADLGLSVEQRLRLAALALHNDYAQHKGRHGVLLYRVVAKRFGPLQQYGYFSRPPIVLKLLEQLERDVADLKPGTLTFDHLLLPHFPYILTPECNVKPIGDWTFPARHDRRHEPETIYRGYWDQVACTYSRVARVLDAASKVPNLWIIIHGDHGSRISSRTKTETPEDLHRTFLAIRGPGVAAEKRPEPIELQAELARFYTSMLASVGTPSAH